ncbi:MAG: histidine kinase [bacterium]
MNIDAVSFSADDDDAPRVRWRSAFVAYTALGVLRFTSFYLDDVTRSEPDTLVRRLLEESTGAYTALLLFPAVVAIERRFPLTLGRWRRVWPAHVAAFLGTSVVHTTLMAVSRTTLYPLLGHGAYDYGRMSVRYFMEASVDLIGYALVVGVLSALRIQERLRLRDVRAAALERDAATAQLRALSLQLQPHFLFNALNTISSTVYDNPVAADELIGRLGDLLRHALRTTERQEVTVSEELETLRAYLTFVDARFGDRVHVVLDVDQTTHELAVPAFLLQPLVENAVHHGAAREFGASSIHVVITRTVAELDIRIDNDVDATRTEPLQIGTGLGTTRDRLRLLYGSAATLATLVTDGQFSVRISMPARELAPRDDTSRIEEHAGAHR